MNWLTVEIPELRGYVVEWSEPGNYLLSRRNSIFRSDDLKPPFDHLADFPAPLYRSLAARSRLAQRLLRFSVNVLLPLPNGEVFVSFDRSVGVLRNGRIDLLAGLKRPCRILRAGAALAADGCVYFGEYLGNPNKEDVNVYRYTPGTDLVEIAYTFAPGQVRHIHGVYRDRFDESLVCLTGDADNECRMLRTRDGFNTFESIGEGDESWRAVSGVFGEDAIWYGTDAEYRANIIYRLDRSSGERNELGQVSGTVFYSCEFNGAKFFTTTAENAPSQVKNVAGLWYIGQENEIELIEEYSKDPWHHTLFGFGTIFFSNGPPAITRLFYGLYATHGDARTYEIKAASAE